MKTGLRSRWSLWGSELCLGLLTVILLVLDVFGVPLTKWLLDGYPLLHGAKALPFLLTMLYGCSIMAWVAVVSLWRLLFLLSKGSSFSQKVIACLGLTSLCCFGVALVTFAGCYHYTPLLLLSIAACFMGCLVRLVQACFRNAMSMQNELDFTV